MKKETRMQHAGLLAALIVIIAVAVAAFGMGCGDSSEPAEGQDEPIRVGAIIPLTGPYAADGELQKRGVELAVDELNESGGVLGRPVELEIFDIQDQLPENIKAAADYLLGKVKVDAVFDGYAGYGPEWLEFGAKSDVIFMRGDGSSRMTEMTAEEPEKYWNTFNVYQTEPEYGARAAEVLLSFGEEYEFPNNKIAMIHGDLEWDLLYTEGIVDVFEKAGWEVVLDETVPYGTTDWGAILTKLRAEQPAVVTCSILSVQDISAFVKQFMQNPPSALLDISYMVTFPEVREAVGADIAGVMGYLTSRYVGDREGDQDFLDRYEAKYGEPYMQHLIIPGMYDEVMIWAKAVENVGDPKDYRAIADFIRANPHSGLAGVYDFNNPGQTAHETPELPIGYCQSQADGSLLFWGTDEFFFPPYITPEWPEK